MKNAPSLLSTSLALLAVILSIVSFSTAQTNNALQDEIRRKQSEIQDLTQTTALQQQDMQRMNEIVNTGATVREKAGPPILRDMGYFAAKKDPDILRIMKKYDHEKFIMKDEQVKEVDKQIAEMQAKQGTKPAPAPAPAPAPSGTPALRP